MAEAKKEIIEDIEDSTGEVEIDEAHGGIVKVNPLADWTADQVHAYVSEQDLPTNRLHLKGYPSVGCDPCSRAIQPGEDIRAGRWWWENEDGKECGLHNRPGKPGPGKQEKAA